MNISTVLIICIYSAPFQMLSNYSYQKITLQALIKDNIFIYTKNRKVPQFVAEYILLITDK